MVKDDDGYCSRRAEAGRRLEPISVHESARRLGETTPLHPHRRAAVWAPTFARRTTATT
jgi:hypothetical protein